MTETMTALVFTAQGRAEVRQVPIPVPAPDELLIRVEAAGLCHTDLDILAERYAAEFPRIPGHEFAGTVVGAGTMAQSRIGSRVAVDPLIACSTCRNCERGYPNLCTRGLAYGAERDGGFAEYAVVRSGNAHDIGALPAPIAALAEPLGCAVNAVERAGADSSMRTAIIGAGPMGVILAIALRGRGVTSITIADRVPQRLERAKRFGVSDTALIRDSVMQDMPEREFDLVIDATGRPEVVQDAVSLLADAGTVIPFGVCPPGSTLTVDPFEIYRRQLRVIGSFSLNQGIPEAIRILTESALPLEEIVTSQFGLSDGIAALDAIGSPETVKVQFDFTPANQ